eukprot:11191601-Lingulodinium_polyedra.AAC.1
MVLLPIAVARLWLRLWVVGSVVNRRSPRAWLGSTICRSPLFWGRMGGPAAATCRRCGNIL